MKNLLILVFILSMLSCGKKNQVGHPMGFQDRAETEAEREKEVDLDLELDSDFDGLSDSKEKEMGLNPHIANIPKIDIKIESKITINSSFYNRDRTIYDSNILSFGKNPLTHIQKIKRNMANLAYGQLYKVEQKFKLDTLERVNAKQQKCLSKRELLDSYKEYVEYSKGLEFKSHNVDFGYKFEMPKMKGITKIKGLSFKTSLNTTSIFSIERSDINYDLNSDNTAFTELFKENSFKQDQISPEQFSDQDNCIETSVQNFTYQIGNEELNHAETFTNSSRGNAHILVYKKGSLVQKSINPKQYTLESFLTESNMSPKYGITGELVSLYGLTNEFLNLNDIDFNYSEDLKKKKWFYFSSVGNKIFNDLTAGSITFLAYLSIEDILKVAANREVLQKKNNNTETIKLENNYPGDRILISTELSGSYQLPAEIDRGQLGYYITARGLKKNSNGCRYQEFNEVRKSTLSITPKKTDLTYYNLTVTGSKRSITPILVKGKLIYEFRVEVSDLNNKTLILDFSRNSKQDYPYTRVFSLWGRAAKYSCERRGNWFGQGYQRKTKIQYSKLLLNFQSTIIRHGIIR